MLNTKTTQNKSSMNLSRKKFGVAIAVTILITCLLTTLTVIAATPTTTFAIFGGNYPAAPNYTVFTDGTSYFAKNQLGVIDYSGTDAADLISDTLAAGGTTFLSKGTYTLTDSIILTPDVRAKLKGEPDSILKASGNINMVDITDTDSYFYVDFEGVTFDLNSEANRGIIVFYSTNSYLSGRITNCRFINLKVGSIGNQVQFDKGVVTGCYFERADYDSQDAFGYDGHNIIFSNNVFHNAYLGTGTADNITISGNIFNNDEWSVSDYRVGTILQPLSNEVSCVTISDNVYVNSVIWIDVVSGATAGAQNIAITGNAFYTGRLLLVDNEDNGWLNHLTVTGNAFCDSGKDSITAVNVADIIIADNTFENSNMDEDAGNLFAHIQLKGQDGTALVYGNSFVRTASGTYDTPYAIRLRDGGVGAVIIKDNHFGNLRVSPIQFDSPPTTVIVQQNYGFTTEAYGTSTGTAGQQTIAHGLSGIPDYVILSNIEDAANAYQSSAADATNIYITAASGKDYVWYAVYEP